ncbi:ankyrin [Colletotrichum sp. SAR 10_66]|nr:ankyrin [Colletotrichum sp. SAR 10_66]
MRGESPIEQSTLSSTSKEISMVMEHTLLLVNASRNVRMHREPNVSFHFGIKRKCMTNCQEEIVAYHAG